MQLKRFLSGFLLLLILTPLSTHAGGALCMYVNGSGEVVCSLYSNSGLAAEGNCAAEARASNPGCGVALTGIDVSCASGIFGSPNVCLDNTYPHNTTGSTTQAACEAAGDRWCPY